MMQRRSFLGAILAAGVAPAIGHAGILMPVKKIITPLTLAQLQLATTSFVRCAIDNAHVQDATVIFPMEIRRFESFRFICDDGRSVYA